jgi:hypothetical protein
VGVATKLRLTILERDRYTCHYCGTPGEPDSLHVEHKTPVASGGTDDPSNLVASCPSCNFKKGIMPYAEFVGAAERSSINFTEAGKLLGFDPRYVRGYAECLDIPVRRSGVSLVMSRGDFRRLREHIESNPSCAYAATATATQ